jgi:hypothetical protein
MAGGDNVTPARGQRRNFGPDFLPDILRLSVRQDRGVGDIRTEGKRSREVIISLP